MTFVRSMSCRGMPWLLFWVAIAAVGCDASSRDREVGQTEFESAPPAEESKDGQGSDEGSGGDGGATRTHEGTDLYRLEGNRLYYLNGYRGLMVFDVQDVDHPKLLGRSAIFGQPIDMIVRDGFATVVIGDWYGANDDGTPFYGSIVRGLDAKDPENIRVVGEAKLRGWVTDDRVVGDVIYAVSKADGWSYGKGYADVVDGGGSSSNGAVVIVSSVSFADGKIEAVDRYEVPGYAGEFYVASNAILLASLQQRYTTQLRYLDISSPDGDIAPRGTIDVPGYINPYSVDNGRWSLDFADGTYAHVLAESDDAKGRFFLSTASFANPDAPTLASTLMIEGSLWGPVKRFVGERLYLSVDSSSVDFQPASTLQVYDLSTPTAPRLAGTSEVPGTVKNLLPAPSNRLFALGYHESPNDHSIALSYLDVANSAAPQLLGTSTFGQDWDRTPAAGTFKAFTLDAERGLVVLPYSSWDSYGSSYRNGLQLIELTGDTLSTAGAVQTKGWVERGIFIGERLVSLSDLTLSVIDYSDRQAPRVVNELTLARNVVATLPTEMGVVEVSSDWWEHDVTHSVIRMLPKGEEPADVDAVPSIEIEGINAHVFANGQLLYVLTKLRCPIDTTDCSQAWAQLQIVDFSSGAPVLRGKLVLPNSLSDPWGWGWYGFWWYDWWGGDSVAQVENDALAVRKWIPKYNSHGNYTGSVSELLILDLANADTPRVASTVVQNDSAGWWGNLRVVGSTLYTTEYEWVDGVDRNRGWVRYYLDAIDLSDRAHPRVKTHINVPGLLVGGDARDPNVIYTMDYRWDGDTARNDFDVLRVNGNKASLLSHVRLRGQVGQTFVVGTTAYVSTEVAEASHVELHAIDASNEKRPVDRVVREDGWGWLLAVVGDRALVITGWSSRQAIDVYLLRDGQAPKFERTARALGWTPNAVSRDADSLYLASGYWGIQRIAL